MMAKLQSIFEEKGSGVLWALLVLSIASILSGGLFSFACLEHRASGFALQRDLHRITAESGIETLACRLEQEKGGLVVRCDEQAKLAAERLKQINELQPQLQKRLETETELSMRQQLMQEELIRAEAQLDLIKDIMLKEPGL